MKNEQKKQGEWEIVERRRTNAEPQPGAGNTRAVGAITTLPTSLPGALNGVEPVVGPLQRYSLRRQAGRELIAAQNERLRMVLEAALKIDRAIIDNRVDQVMAEMRDERLAFLSHLGGRELERMKELAGNVERLFTQWFKEVQEKNMPEFMRNTMIDRLIKRFEREMNVIFKIDE